MQLVTLTDVRRHLNITGSNDDNELEETAQAAEELVLQRIRPVLAATTTRVVQPSRSGTALLPHYPVTGVVSVTDSSGTAVAYSANLDSGEVFTSWSGPLTIRYTVGAGAVPADVRRAVLEVTGHLWASQRARRAPSRSAPDIGPDPSLGFALPNAALDLIRPYLKPSGQVG